MTDVLTEQPDGSEFGPNPEQVEFFDIVDLAGINDIDPSSVTDRWTLTDDGKLFVINNTQNGPDSSPDILTGPTDDGSVLYVASADCVNLIKNTAGIEGGFTFRDHPVGHGTGSMTRKIPYKSFLNDRTAGIWTLQSPVLGEALHDDQASLATESHDRRIFDHLIAAMSATSNQTDFLHSFHALATSNLEEDSAEKIAIEVMLARFIDDVFFGSGREDSGNLVLAIDKDDIYQEANLTAAVLSKLPGFNVDLLSVYLDGLAAVSSRLQRQTGFDPIREQAAARARAEKIRETFKL